MKLYHGHERTVTCLSVFIDLIAAGGNDNLCLGKIIENEQNKICILF